MTGWVALLVIDASTVGLSRARWGTLILSSDPGRRALIGVQLAVGCQLARRSLATPLAISSEPARRRVAAVIVAITSGVVVAAAYGGHAEIGGSWLLGVGLRALHVGSIGLWIGSIAVVWILARADRSMVTLWPTVSRLAAIGVAIAGASGLLLSGRTVATVTGLLGATYGRRVVIKAALLAILALLGAVAARQVRSGREPNASP